MPILTFVGDKMFNIDVFNQPVKRDYRFCHLHIRGGFDPTTTLVSEYPEFATAFAGNGTQAIDLTLHDLKETGCPGSVVNLNTSNDPNVSFRYAFDSLDITDCGGRYNIIIGTSEDPESTVSLTGSKIVQNPYSLSDDSNITANLRVNGVKYTYVAGNDLFNLSENNPAIKVCEMDSFVTVNTVGPQLVSIHSNAIEANTGLISVAQGMDDRGSTIQNVVIDGNILCGAWNIQQFFLLCATGISIRNNLCWQPDLASINGLGLGAWSNFFLETDATGGQSIGVAPVSVYANTLINDRSDANNNGTSQIIGDKNGQFLAAGVNMTHHNVIHYENLSPPQIASEPLEAQPVFIPRSRVGRIRSEDRPSPQPDTSRATLQDMQNHRPLPGSTAQGGVVNVPVGNPDLTGYVRIAPFDVGAWTSGSV